MIVRVAFFSTFLVGVFTSSTGIAADKVKLVIGQVDAWVNQMPFIGTKAGIFQKHGIELETFATQGAGETLQVIISGAADIALGVGTSGAMRAFARGAPLRVLSAGYTGVQDTYWYVPANSPIKSLGDLTENHTIAYSTNGSTGHNVVLNFVKELGVKAKPMATGGPTATLTMTMTGQVDVGWGVVPFALADVEAGKVRVIARGSDVPSLRNQTVRVQIVNSDALKARKDVMIRFMRAYRESLDFMYSDPRAIQWYSETSKQAEKTVIKQRDEFNPKEALSPDRISDIDLVMRDAVDLKFLDAPLTKEQLAEFFQIPPPGS